MTTRQIFRLRAVWMGADFRKSDHTLLLDFRAVPHYPGDLESNGVFCFVAATGNQIMWVFPSHKVNGREVVDSRRWRILGGHWDAMMLGNYAAEVGIKLEGVKMFQEQYEARRLEKRNAK